MVMPGANIMLRVTIEVVPSRDMMAQRLVHSFYIEVHGSSLARGSSVNSAVETGTWKELRRKGGQV